MGSILNPQDDHNMTDETGRIAIWQHGMGSLVARPLTGVGVSNFVRAQWQSPRRRFIYLSTCYLYLQIAFFGWSVGGSFVSHAYHVPFYLLAALLGSTLLLLERETAAQPTLRTVR